MFLRLQDRRIARAIISAIPCASTSASASISLGPYPPFETGLILSDMNKSGYHTLPLVTTTT